MNRFALILLGWLSVGAGVGGAADDPPAPAKKPQWFASAVKEFKLTCEPAEAKPGSTATLILTLDLKPGFTVYPLKQTDEAAEGMVSQLEFPKPAAVVFVGEVLEPKDVKTKREPDLGIRELKYFTGKVEFRRKFVVTPTQSAGEITLTLPAIKFAVCDEASCFPPKAFSAETKFTVLPGPAVPIDAKYADEVAKALAEKE